MSRKQLCESIYGSSVSQGLAAQIDQLLETYRSKIKVEETRSLDHRDAFLITYGDSVTEGGKRPLQVLDRFLEQYGTHFSHVHILPFYPYSSDDGFSVIDYKEVNEQLGEWSDIQALASKRSLMFDAVINHISAKSAWVQEHLSNEPSARKLVYEGDPTDDWSQVVRPRTSPLFHTFINQEGKKITLWTTFSEDQVDLDYRNPSLLLAVLNVLLYYLSQGASVLRLDAIGFMWKEAGTTCIHLPQTHALIQLMRSVLTEAHPSVKLITETNVPHLENISYFGDGTNEAHLVYNFTLPPLLAYSLLSASASKFYQWASSLSLPSNEVCFFNFLASHDGVGVRPVQGILTDDERQVLIDAAEANGGRVNYKANTSGGKDPYEINCNYFSLLHGAAGDATQGLKRMVLAHALLVAFPGVPAVYIHSLIGSENDLKGMERAGYNRAINREKVDFQRVSEELEDHQSTRHRIYTEINSLLALKKEVPAFDPYASFHFELDNDALLVLHRGRDEVSCYFNFSSSAQRMKLSQAGKDLRNHQTYEKGDELVIEGLGFAWLSHID